ncbi:MAG: Ni/Fe-hydrogenase cytochrome b subunit [Planctomycetes bacterium]|nr:Ni/Fe-hydrogenase cytochrome b subunit [Planctomycetota bacterium]
MTHPRPRHTWLTDVARFGLLVRDAIRPRATPFNLAATVVLSLGLVVTWIRFTRGLGATTNLSDNYPWGLWIGFDMLCGVALAAGGFVLAAAVELFHLERYRGFVRPAILTAFLGYVLAVLGLLMDLGRPWAIWHPMVFWQPHSVMFEVAWCVMLYSTVLFLECLPSVCERFRLRRTLALVRRAMLALTVVGVVLSTMHQSSLGGLFLLAPAKLHPLWYSQLIPLLFFISAVIAGLSMVILESTLSHRLFHSQVADQRPADVDRLVIGLGKAASVVLLVYCCVKTIAVMKAGTWNLLPTPYGVLFLVEVLGLGLLPCALYAHAARVGSATLTRCASVLAILGVVLNRLNISVIAFRWNEPVRYVPHWMEVVLSVALITLGLVAFRWIVNTLPVLGARPTLTPDHGEAVSSKAAPSRGAVSGNDDGHAPSKEVSTCLRSPL